MCYIVFAPAGAEIQSSWVEAAQKINPDGFGLSYFLGSRLVTFKSLDFTDFLSKLESIPVDTDRLIHLRFATKGVVSVDNIQPIVSQNRAVAHNGTISGFGNHIISDSYDFNQKVLKKMTLAHIQKKRQELEKVIGWSKIVIMEAERTIILNERKGGWLHGCWHSDPSYAEDRFFHDDYLLSYEDLLYSAVSKLRKVKNDYPFIEELEEVIQLLEISLEL